MLYNPFLFEGDALIIIWTISFAKVFFVFIFEFKRYIVVSGPSRMYFAVFCRPLMSIYESRENSDVVSDVRSGP